jgi:hypothetical protein
MHFRNIDKDSRSDLVNFPQNYFLPKLDNNQIILLEETNLISPYQKAQILQLTTGTRQTTEVWSKENNPEELEIFFKKLPFFTSTISYIKKENKVNFENFVELKVLQVSVSDYVSKYIHNYWQTFSLYDQGVLYGYPVTTISAFAYFIERHNFLGEKRKEYTTAMEAIGPGIYSKIFFEDEKKHYEKIWELISNTSPKIAEECKKYTKNFHLGIK